MTSTEYVAPWLYWSLFPIHRFFIPFYFGEIKVDGRENLPEKGAVVFAPKHYSRWDPVVISLLSKQPLRFMTNANQFEGFQGWIIKRLGAFPIDLEHPQISSFRTAIELLSEGKKLVMFPEGGIEREQILRSLKPGLARLVLQAEASDSKGDLTIPIVPIAISYQPDAVRGAKIWIKISPPIYSHQYRQDKDRKTAIAITSALETALKNNLQQMIT